MARARRDREVKTSAPPDAGPRRADARVVALRCVLLVALATSAMMVVDYQGAAPTFCGSGSGCDAVRLSDFTVDFTHALGLTIPQVGMIGNLFLLAGAILAHKKLHHRLLAIATTLGAALAALLVFVQASEIGRYCAYCMVADVSVIGSAALAWWLSLRPPADSPHSGPTRTNVVWALAATVIVALPMVWARYPIVPPLPAEIARVQVPGVVTVVEFTDFECPYCRALAPELEKLVAAHPGRVRFVRRMMPLGMHAGAEPAALAYLCTPEDKRDAMAAELYDMPEPLLAVGGPVAAKKLGLDADALSKCMGSDDAKKSLDAEKAAFGSLGLHGLPLTFVGRRAVVGYLPSKIASAFDAELAGSTLELPLWALFGTTALTIALAAAFALSRSRNPVAV